MAAILSRPQYVNAPADETGICCEKCVNTMTADGPGPWNHKVIYSHITDNEG